MNTPTHIPGSTLASSHHCPINISNYQHLKENKSLAEERATRSIEGLIAHLNNTLSNKR